MILKNQSAEASEASSEEIIDLANYSTRKKTISKMSRKDYHKLYWKKNKDEILNKRKMAKSNEIIVIIVKKSDKVSRCTVKKTDRNGPKNMSQI